MNLRTVHTWSSLIPADDDHPYRTGAWRPQVTEYDADDLDVVEGAIPAELDGVYLRNTENPIHDAIGRYHPFDGDGMFHAIRFGGGRASYRNRMVRTAGLAAELEAGAPLWAGIIEPPARSLRDGWGARGKMKDASSTDVLERLGVDAFVGYVRATAPAFVIANRDEAAALGLGDPVTAGRVLSRCRRTAFVIKDGADPTRVLRHRTPELVVPVRPVDGIRDSTGAGDAFAAGFLTGVLAGRDLRSACEDGHALAASVLRSPGATASIPLVVPPPVGAAASAHERKGRTR